MEGLDFLPRNLETKQDVLLGLSRVDFWILIVDKFFGKWKAHI